MRPGPKFEITQEMAIANMRTVYYRLQPEALTTRLYGEHGSFSLRAIERKWKWTELCQLAGIPCGEKGRKKLEHHLCSQCRKGLASSRFWYCWDCRRRQKRNSGGVA